MQSTLTFSVLSSAGCFISSSEGSSSVRISFSEHEPTLDSEHVSLVSFNMAADSSPFVLFVKSAHSSSSPSAIAGVITTIGLELRRLESSEHNESLLSFWLSLQVNAVMSTSLSSWLLGWPLSVSAKFELGLLNVSVPDSKTSPVFFVLDTRLLRSACFPWTLVFVELLRSTLSPLWLYLESAFVNIHSLKGGVLFDKSILLPSSQLVCSQFPDWVFVLEKTCPFSAAICSAKVWLDILERKLSVEVWQLYFWRISSTNALEDVDLHVELRSLMTWPLRLRNTLTERDGIPISSL